MANGGIEYLEKVGVSARHYIDRIVFFLFVAAAMLHPLLPWATSTKLLVAIFIYLLGTSLDFLSTYVAVSRYGLEVEQNPLLKYVASRIGFVLAYVALELFFLVLLLFLSGFIMPTPLDKLITALLMLGGSHLPPGILNFLHMAGYLK